MLRVFFATQIIGDNRKDTEFDKSTLTMKFNKFINSIYLMRINFHEDYFSRAQKYRISGGLIFTN